MSAREELTDDAAEALADLANSPDITDTADSGPLPPMTDPDAYDEAAPAAGGKGRGERAYDAREEALDEGAADAIGKGFGRAYQRATGDELDGESGAVLSDWVRQLLDLSRRFDLGPWPRFGLTSAIAALILAPAVIDLSRTFGRKPT